MTGLESISGLWSRTRVTLGQANWWVQVLPDGDPCQDTEFHVHIFGRLHQSAKVGLETCVH